MAFRTDSPKDGESLYGFLRRLANLNAYAHISEFLSAAGIPLGRPLVENLEDYAVNLGVSSASLGSISPSATASDPALEWRFQRNLFEAICPACIAERKPWQAIWRHSLVSACADHRLRLQSNCPRCNENLSPIRGGLRSCECGLAFEHFPDDPADDYECKITVLLNRRHEPAQTNLIPFENGIPGDIGSFLFFLASGSVETRTGKAGKTPLPQTPSEAATFMAPAASALSSWPDGFDETVLQRMRASPLQGNSAPEILGTWYQRLMRFRAAEYEPFRERVGRVIAKEFEGTYTGNLVVTDEGSWQTATSAAREIGIRGERIVEAVREGRLLGKQHRSGFGHVHTVIPRTEVAEAIASRRRFLTAKGAMELLAVSKKQFGLLCEAGVVEKVARDQRPPLVDGEYDREALSELVERISKASRGWNDGEDLIAFRDINLRRTTDRSALLALLRAIADLRVVARNSKEPRALGDIEFDRAVISRHLQTETSPKSYTALEVTEITGWKHECVTHWCREGLLEATQARLGGAQSYQITPAALSEFQRRYLVVSDLAQTKGSSSRHIMSTLSERGIEIIGAKSVQNTRRCCLVRSTDLIVV